MRREKKFCSRSFFRRLSGIRSSSSIRAAMGSISPSANSRAMARSISCSSVSWKFIGAPTRGSSVLVEATSRLPAETTRRHHRFEERTGPVLAVSEALVEHVHDVEADVDADEIGEGQWTHGMVHAELHDGVDRLAIG